MTFPSGMQDNLLKVTGSSVTGEATTNTSLKDMNMQLNTPSSRKSFGKTIMEVTENTTLTTTTRELEKKDHTSIIDHKTINTTSITIIIMVIMEDMDIQQQRLTGQSGHESDTIDAFCTNILQFVLDFNRPSTALIAIRTHHGILFDDELTVDLQTIFHLKSLSNAKESILQATRCTINDDITFQSKGCVTEKSWVKQWSRGEGLLDMSCSLIFSLNLSNLSEAFLPFISTEMTTNNLSHV